jgi:hypothetical protein
VSARGAVQSVRRFIEERLFLHLVYCRVFGSGDGPLVLSDLARKFGGSRSSVVFGKPDATAYHEGQRSVVLYIRKRLHLTDEEVASLEARGQMPEGWGDPLANIEETT